MLLGWFVVGFGYSGGSLLAAATPTVVGIVLVGTWGCGWEAGSDRWGGRVGLPDGSWRGDGFYFVCLLPILRLWIMQLQIKMDSADSDNVVYLQSVGEDHPLYDFHRTNKFHLLLTIRYIYQTLLSLQTRTIFKMLPKTFPSLAQANYRFATLFKPQNLILIRHAESVFNAKCHQYPEMDIYGKTAEEEFHHDPSIIDCQITENAYKSMRREEFQKYFQTRGPQNTIFFVSPMLRALQTAQLIIDVVNKNYEVKVIPQLSEVLSKICDFSSGINNKKQQFVGFDFRHLDQWILENNLCEFTQNWQDPFLDDQLKSSVDASNVAGRRYLRALKQRFPRPLQSAEKCKSRSIEGFNKIYEISNLLEYKNAVVISHNRILKNIESYLRGSEVEDFANLEIRKIRLPERIRSATDNE